VAIGPLNRAATTPPNRFSRRNQRSSSTAAVAAVAVMPRRSEASALRRAVVVPRHSGPHVGRGADVGQPSSPCRRNHLFDAIPGMPAKSRADPIGRSDHAGGITGNKLYRIRRSADDRSTGSLP
jgi:hypothetical protein